MRTSFILHLDSLDILDELSNEEAGILLRAMRDFNREEEPTLTGLMKVVFLPFKNQFIRDEIKWDEKKEGKSKAGRMGNLKKYTPDLYQQVTDNQISLDEAEEVAKGRKCEVSDSLLSQNVADSRLNKSVSVSDKETINYDRIFNSFKELTGKKIISFSDKCKGQLRQRLKEGFTYEDIESAIKNCKNNEWHSKPENSHYLTLEFILRSGSIEKYKSAMTTQSERKLLRLPQEYENYMGMELGLLLSRIKIQKGVQYIPDITKAQYDSLPRDSFNMYESLIKNGNCKIIEE